MKKLKIKKDNGPLIDTKKTFKGWGSLVKNEG